MINYMVDKIDEEGQLSRVNESFLFKYFRKFNEEMQEKLLKYYEVEGEQKYIESMKRNPEKYGLTFTAFKLLEE